MSKSTMLKLSLLLVLGAFLVVEGYYTYRLYQSPEASSASAAGSESSAAGEQASPGESGEESFDYVFVHRADPSSISANSTYLQSPALDGEPDAVIFITQSWNPGGGAGAYNEHPVGVWYDSEREQWAIFNQDRAPMPEGVAFNVAISASER